ncbi:unnamed protein product [Pylaiella littoralis]
MCRSPTMLFPKAAITRAVEAALPEGMVATDGTLEAINRGCAEFVSLVSTESSTVLEDVGNHSIMSKKDVVDAMKRLGLEVYLAEAEDRAAEDVAKVQANKKRKKKTKPSKEEEAAAAKRQRELLEATAKSFYDEQGL